MFNQKAVHPLIAHLTTTQSTAAHPTAANLTAAHPTAVHPTTAIIYPRLLWSSF